MHEPVSQPSARRRRRGMIMPDGQPFGLAFIGCGSYGRSLADSAASSKLLRIAACFDTHSAAAADFARKYNTQSYADLDTLLAQDEIEGVVIATPNNAHMPPAVQAARAGKHVFVDKPIANTLEDALGIVSETGRAGVTLAVGHNARRFPGHRKMKELISQGVVGVPVTVEANFSHSGGLGLTPAMWRSSRAECPGLPLMQLGVHFTDTLQYLLGDISEVSSFMAHAAIPVDNDDATVSLLRFETGLLGYLGSNYASPHVYYVNVYGTAGNLYCEGGQAVSFRKAGSAEREQFAVEPSDTQVEELEEFARSARTGARFEVDGEAAVKALAVVSAALKSHQEGRPIRTEDLIAQARKAVPRL